MPKTYSTRQAIVHSQHRYLEKPVPVASRQTGLLRLRRPTQKFVLQLIRMVSLKIVVADPISDAERPMKVSLKPSGLVIIVFCVDLPNPQIPLRSR